MPNHHKNVKMLTVDLNIYVQMLGTWKTINNYNTQLGPFGFQFSCIVDLATSERTLWWQTVPWPAPACV